MKTKIGILRILLDLVFFSLVGGLIYGVDYLVSLITGNRIFN